MGKGVNSNKLLIVELSSIIEELREDRELLPYYRVMPMHEMIGILLSRYPYIENYSLLASMTFDNHYTVFKKDITIKEEDLLKDKYAEVSLKLQNFMYFLLRDQLKVMRCEFIKWVNDSSIIVRFLS